MSAFYRQTSPQSHNLASQRRTPQQLLWPRAKTQQFATVKTSREGRVARCLNFPQGGFTDEDNREEVDQKSSGYSCALANS